MPEAKFDTRRRYFTARELHGEPLPADRLLYLELLEVDEDAGVARFSYELAVEDGELWMATVDGWASRAAVVSAVREAAVVQLVDGGTLEIPLSRLPQLTQLEVRSPDLQDVTVYRVETRGRSARDFRYTTHPDLAEAIAAARGYLVENAPDDYSLTDDPQEATHGFVDAGDGDWSIVPLAQVDGTARLARIPDDTYRAYGAA